MDTTTFCLRAKDSTDGLCVGNNQQIATVVLNQLLQDSSRSVVELEKKPVAGISHMLKRNQQVHSFKCVPVAVLKTTKEKLVNRRNFRRKHIRDSNTIVYSNEKIRRIVQLPGIKETRVSMTFRVVRTNQYNQDLGLIHSTNGNHLESPNEGHFAADCNRLKKDDRNKRDDRRADDRYRKEERYRRDEEDNERTVDRSKDKSKDKFKERSNDRRMKTSSNKRFSRKHDRKVLVAEESTKNWADSDSESSSSSSSSSDSEMEEVHCLMADQTDDDEVFDFSNVEFTRDDLVTALNDMVKEYRKLSHSFEEAKAENICLKCSSIESNSDEFEDIEILKTELSKLQAENEMLKDETSELKAEIEALNQLVSSWNHSSRVLHKLNKNQKLASDKTGVGFNSSEFSEGETSTQSRSAYDKFNKMSFVKADMIYNCLESVKYDDQNSPKLSDNGKAGIGFSKPESSSLTG
ncbi:hypothetical protein F511_33156 [Dorcoceras hygrometricum]|uniref:Uncharacterized protein n=1 Tax=Dorcoceras hygrometricum TaxID=472368 RepID=A0A2Z7C0Y3_9LAMI|nr:hypothetical protein F511_33156 [Dorcoceras hygrometricum]